MKITLISPSPHIPTMIGHGVRILSSCLKREGWNVEILFLPRNVGDLYGEKVIEDVIDLCKDANLIGISLMTDDLCAVAPLTRKLSQNLRVPIVWGGVHPTICPEQCMEHVDMICVGEGEETLVELVRRMERGSDPQDIEGIWFKVEGKIKRNPLRPLLQDLDALPFPDYDSRTQYALVDGAMEQVSEALLRRTVGQYYLTLTSRGCPFRCAYCWNHTIHRMHPNEQIIRKRSMTNVVQELEAAKQRFPFVRMICIDDDAFFLRDTEEIREFSEKYRARVRLPLWVTGSTPLTIEREKLELLTRSGLASVRMGIQSASPRTLSLFGRQYSGEQILSAAELIEEFRSSIREPQYDVILDNPWETEEDIVVTLRLLSHLPVPYRLFLFPLRLYPGTDLYEGALKEGWLSPGEREFLRPHHHRLKNTYWNRLFLLMDRRASQGKRISPRMMKWLTHGFLRRIGLSQAVYRRVEAGHGESLREALWDLIRRPFATMKEKEGPAFLLPPHME